MDEIISKAAGKKAIQENHVPSTKKTSDDTIKGKPITKASNANLDNKPKQVADHMCIKAVIQETGKNTSIIIDLAKYPIQKKLIGKKVGDLFQLQFLRVTRILLMNTTGSSIRALAVAKR